jgi:glycosyltransferase involved in cell wall biosynthesis
VQSRIAQAYGICAEVIHPPVSLDVRGPQERPRQDLDPGFLLVVARPRGYKNVRLVCEALASAPWLRLVVVGGLPDSPGGNWPAHLIGLRHITDAQLRWLYAHCSALIAMSHEDFGLTPIEANTFGRPVVALRAGGYLDTVIDGITGCFTEWPTIDRIRETIARVLSTDWDGDRIRAHAQLYNRTSFEEAIHKVLLETIAEHRRQPRSNYTTR